MRYSIIHHDVRKVFDLTMSAYLVCDSIHQLSQQGPTNKTDTEISEFLGIDRSHVGHLKNTLVEKGLITWDQNGLKTTNAWFEAVTFAAGKFPTKRGKSPNNGENPRDTIYKEVKNVITANADFTITKEEDTRKTTKVVNAEYEKGLRWAEKRRNQKFVNRIKQYSALKKAKEAGISEERLTERWMELENEPFYQEHGLDWMMVLSSFDKR